MPFPGFGHRCWAPLGLVFILIGGGTRAEDTANAPAVAARVGEELILMADVDGEIERAARQRKLENRPTPLLRAKTLEHLVERKLVLRFVAEQRMAATEQEIELAIAGISQRLLQKEMTLDEHLKNNGMSPSQYRQAVAWQIGWQRYLDKFLTDENLQRYFQEHHRDYDGTELRVAHILLPVPQDADVEAVAKVREQAGQIRLEIQQGKLTFADAARQHSTAPTAKNGGDIGIIQRREPMPEEFSRAAFALEKDAISEPVLTAFGVHLIQCLEIKPGQRPWTESRKELRTDVAAYLFRWIVDRQRPATKIEFTGEAPYLDPESKELVVKTPS